jgi:hypothetical protein
MPWIGIVLAPASRRSTRSHDANQRRLHGDEEEVREEVRNAQVRSGGEQEGRERDAPAKARDAQVRPWGQGWNGEEPEAGNRDRSVGSEEEGSEGAAQELREKGLVEEELAKALIVSKALLLMT